MPTISPDKIAVLLEPYVGSAAMPSGIYLQLHQYLDLILKWNTRINLTAIREPEQIVQRHFGESLFAGLHLNSKIIAAPLSTLEPCNSLLDLGSGAGFPGIPIQLLWPEIPVTLAESRSRKAAFLQEVIRTLGLRTKIWANRAEAMPSDIQFHTVALRAVDEMESAVAEAARRASQRLLILDMRGTESLPPACRVVHSIDLPNSLNGILLIADRISQNQ